MRDRSVLDKRELPDKSFDRLWDSIILPLEQKERLVAQVLLEFTLREQIDSASLPIHGLIVLVGPPGTGKTSLAKGLASKASSLLKGSNITFLEVEPHSLTSSALGKSQREVLNFFQQTVAEHASHGPLIVLLDEVETLAANRARMSMEANPIDVHRATDAVLASLDSLAQRFPRLLFIATSNFETAVDAAFLSRADLVERIEKPDRDGCEAILKDTIATLAKKWPKLRHFCDNGHFTSLVESAVGLDGRQIRKAVLRAFTFDKKVALAPETLRFEHLQKSFAMVKEAVE